MLNEDIHSLINTVDKMAQKRALVAASLNLGFSDTFTQDMEDLKATEEPFPPEVQPTTAAPAPLVERTEHEKAEALKQKITEKQRKRLFAIVAECAEIRHPDLPPEEYKAQGQEMLKGVMLTYGLESTKDITNETYEAIILDMQR